MDHRGRFQAQGKSLYKSENWAQMHPFSCIRAKVLLRRLENKLPKRERYIRKNAFDKCAYFIDDAYKNRGVNIANMGSPLRKSWPVNSEERVDLEVLSGIAFV